MLVSGILGKAIGQLGGYSWLTSNRNGGLFLRADALVCTLGVMEIELCFPSLERNNTKYVYSYLANSCMDCQ
jgi:hypothetical protein